MTDEKFTDGIGNIRFSGGAVHIQFIKTGQTTSDGANIQEEVTNLVMSQDGFVSTYNTMQKMILKLGDMGKLSINQSKS